MRNIDEILNKKRLIKNTIEVNIFYKRYREKTEIDIIGGQKQNIILEILQLTHYNLISFYCSTFFSILFFYFELKIRN